MENATKALIIAGAILIAILLISVGIMVMNSTDSVTSTMGTEMDSTAIQAFNSKFSQYQGSQKGSAVKTLMTTITASNASDDGTHQITSLTGPGASSSDVATAAGEIAATVKSTTTYTVTITDTDADGYYDTIAIS